MGANRVPILVPVLVLAVVVPGAPGGGFTYQGQLKQNGSLISGSCDLHCSLWDASTGGTQIGGNQIVSGVTVANGLFTVELNAAGEFGSEAFKSPNRWLQIAVRSPAGGGSYTTLSRQKLTAAPYAMGLQFPIDAQAQMRGGTAFSILNGYGTAIQGHSLGDGSNPGIGLFGSIYGDGYGVRGGAATNGTGVWGSSESGTGVSGTSNSGAGVTGSSSTAGVWGASDSGFGVTGTSNSGTGVFGSSTNGWASYFEGDSFFSGNVGIGTTDPQQKLSVSAGLVLDQANANDGLGASLANSPSLTFGSLSGEGIFSKRTSGGNQYGLELCTNHQSRLAITSSGNIGVGTTTPGYPLTFSDALGDKISLNGQSGNHHGFGMQANELQIMTMGSGDHISFGWGRSGAFTEKMRVMGTGNVGIGTTNPTAKLHIGGTAGTDGIKFPDGTLQTTAATGDAVGGRNPRQIATLRWYEANQKNLAFVTGYKPAGICFDGTYIWVANSGTTTVTKLLASDGSPVGTYTSGTSPVSIAFDGNCVWVVNSGGNSVSYLRASDGYLLGTYAVGSNPHAVAYDGANIWVTNMNSDTVTKLTTGGAVVGTYSAGYEPRGIAFDGTNIWIANSWYNGSTVTKLRGSDGSLLGTYTVDPGAEGVAFDGTYVWVTCSGTNTVIRLRASSGAWSGRCTVGYGPRGIAFDGCNMWVANNDDNTMTKLRCSDGSVIGTYSVGAKPIGVAFDGINTWVTSETDSLVYRR